MSDPLFSIVIPYKQRLDNIRLVLASLAEQTLDRAAFEVVVGVFENSPDYTAACRQVSARVSVVSVVCDREWQVGEARNMALRQARGQVVVLLDADVVVPPTFLEELYERHYAYGQQICVVGQLVDYDNNTSDTDTVEVRPFAYYRSLLADLAAGGDVRSDPRLTARHVIPWSFAWTALIAVPAALVRRHGLFFDPGFRGYGVEDLEWAYRVCATGTPIVMAADVYGIHLPHIRSLAANRRTEAANYRYFLRKWPAVDVELACAFGDFAANERYPALRRELRDVFGADRVPAVLRGLVAGVDTLVVGATTDGTGRVLADPPVAFDTEPSVLPLAGLALPYDDDSVAECLVLPPVDRLSAAYRDVIHAEAARVAQHVLARQPGTAPQHDTAAPQHDTAAPQHDTAAVR